MLYVVGKAMHKFVLILLAWAFCSILPIRATDPPTQTFQDRVIQRSNFGALFYAQHPVTVFSDHYLHHLVFQLPHKAITLQLNFMREFTQDLVNTSQNNNSSSLYLIMNQIIKTQTKHIAFLLDTVYSLIPELVYPSDQARTSRAVCWVCGKLNQWLQGLAMQDDLLTLQHLVESSQNLTQSRFESIEKSLSALSSYSQITDSKIDALKVITQQLRVQSMSLLSSVKDQRMHLQLLTATLLEAINSDDYADQLVLLHSSLLMLKSHFLTFDLLPFEQAKVLIQQIDQHVQESGFLYLADKHPLSLYEDTDLYYFRVNETIHIGIKLKVTPFKAPLILFKLVTFSIQVDSEHTTTLSRQPQYIAINDIDEMYLTFDDTPTLQDDKFYFMGHGQHVLWPKSTPTCILALFQDDLSTARSLCQTLFEPFNQKPTAVHLGGDMFLFQNLHKIQLTSVGGTTHEVILNSAPRSTYIPCNNKITTAAGILYSSHCRVPPKFNSTYITGRVANLHVLTSLIDDELMAKMRADISLTTSLNFTLPKIKLFEFEDPQMDAAFRTLDQPQIPLSAVINQTLQDGIVYKTESDKLVHDLQALGLRLRSGFQWGDLTSWLAYPVNLPTNLCILTLFCISGYLGYRVHTLASALVLLQRPQPVAMQSLTFEQQLNEYLKQKQITTTTAPLIKFPFDFKFQVARDFHVFEFFIFLILLIMCLYFIWCKIRRHQSRHQLELVLEISNRNDSVKVSLMKLIHHADLYSFSAAEFLTHLSIRGSLRHPRLHINWPTFRIKHRLLSLSLEIPPITQLSYWTAFKARRILATHYEVLMFTRELNSEKYHIVPLLGSSWATFQSSQVEREDRPLRATQSLMLAGSSPPQYV
jgi:hypothetical protein